MGKRGSARGQQGGSGGAVCVARCRMTQRRLKGQSQWIKLNLLVAIDHSKSHQVTVTMPPPLIIEGQSKNLNHFVAASCRIKRNSETAVGGPNIGVSEFYNFQIAHRIASRPNRIIASSKQRFSICLVRR